KLATVFADMPDGMLLLAKDGKVLLLNATSARLLGLQNEDIIAKTFGPQLFPGFEFSPPFRNMDSFEAKVTAVELVRKKGKDLTISALVHRLHSAETSSHEGYLALLRDTTDEKRGERLKR